VTFFFLSKRQRQKKNGYKNVFCSSMCKEKRKNILIRKATTLLVKVSLSFYYHLISKLNLNDYSTWEKQHKWSSSSMTGFFPENEKFACSIFLWAAGIYKKKLTERQTHLHKNIIILLVLIKNILKKCVNKNDFIDCSEKQNWKKAKIKNKEKKKIIIMKMRVFLILCAPLLCVLPIIKKKLQTL